MEEIKRDKSWLGNLLESIVSAFNKLLEGVKKHGVMLSLFSVIIILILYSFILNPVHIGDMIEAHWNKKLQEDKFAKKEMIERRYEANEKVADIMTQILYEYNCNRVILLEKHNSVASLGNVDFLYLSCTLEMLDNHNSELDYISEDLQRQMTVNLLGSDVIGLLKHSKYLYYDNLQSYKRSQCRLLNKLKSEGEKQCIIYPFRDSKNRPLLIMVICGDNLNVKEITNYINEKQKQISDLLIFD